MCWPKEMFHCSKNLWEWNKKTKSLKRLNQESLTTFHNNRVCLFSFFKELFSHEHWHFNHVCFVCHPPQLEWAADKSISFSLSLQRNKDNLFDRVSVSYAHSLNQKLCWTFTGDMKWPFSQLYDSLYQYLILEQDPGTNWKKLPLLRVYHNMESSHTMLPSEY